MKRKLIYLFFSIVVINLFIYFPVNQLQAAVQKQKYQLAVYFESWDRIFVALTIPGFESLAPFTQEQFEQMLGEFDGDKSLVVVTIAKMSSIDRQERRLADEYKIEKLLKSHEFKKVVFKIREEFSE